MAQHTNNAVDATRHPITPTASAKPKPSTPTTAPYPSASPIAAPRERGRKWLGMSSALGSESTATSASVTAGERSTVAAAALR
jgi:hypothetical protein